MDESNKEMAGLTEKDKLEWIQTYETITNMQKSGGIRDRMVTKIKENPFVPAGMLATTMALTYGVYSMKSGNKKQSQLMMRCRVLAQGFTVGAILLGVAYASIFKPCKSQT